MPDTVKVIAMLLENEKNGEEITLDTKRKLFINPSDMSIVCTWIPSAELELVEDNREKSFPVHIRNTDNEAFARGTWIYS